jgi:hydroxyacylglutathione hydrolase
MIIEQIYTGCLAQGAYYIESAGEALVIDPLREVQPYIERAQKNGARIKYILETHFHADFVSGHVELARKTGATIVYGPQAKTAFEAKIAQDGELLSLGNLQVKVLHTPGHTLESSCYLLLDAHQKPHALFTGDTLFIGDVGRPDLAQKSDITATDLAGMLFDSLRNKLMPLPDDLWVYPAHGAGSACGKNMSKETFDRLGNQKLFNYALRADMSKEEFVQEVTQGLELVPPPYYFPQNVRINQRGAPDLASIKKQVRALSVAEFETLANETGALLLDTRPSQTFKEGFIPNAINIGIKGDFAPWVGTLLTDIQQPILFVAEESQVEEVITRLSRVGYDHILGYLAGGFEAWKAAGQEIDQILSLSAADFSQRWQQSPTPLAVVDVRKPTEYAGSHVAGSTNIPLAQLSQHMEAFSKTRPQYIHCAGGYRSMIAVSILKARGFEQVVEVAGGFGAISQTSVPLASS